MKIMDIPADYFRRPSEVGTSSSLIVGEAEETLAFSSLRSFLEFHEASWSYLAFLGVPWSSLEFLGIPWNSLEFQESFKVFLKNSWAP